MTATPAHSLVVRDGGDLGVAASPSVVNGMPVLRGHFSVFDEWAEINTLSEGRFLERVQRGAFAKTLREDAARIRVLLEHGRDLAVGNRPLGAVLALNEDQRGAAYQVQLLNAAYVRELLPALEAGLYASSFRFSVRAERFDARPARSEHNPS